MLTAIRLPLSVPPGTMRLTHSFGSTFRVEVVTFKPDEVPGVYVLSIDDGAAGRGSRTLELELGNATDSVVELAVYFVGEYIEAPP